MYSAIIQSSVCHRGDQGSILVQVYVEFTLEYVMNPCTSGFGGLVVSMLTSGTQDRGFAPGRSRRIFRAKKSSACLPSEGK
jgi:hypothetical protein